MNYHSILLVGLLSLTSIINTGCSEDSVKECAVCSGSTIKAGNVVLFNGSIEETDISVNGVVKTIPAQNFLGSQYRIYTEDDHALEISYSGSSNTPVIQNNGTTYAYVATGNCSDGYILDTVGNEKLRLINVSGFTDVTNADLNISRNSVKINLPSDPSNCSVTATYSGPTDGVWRVQIYGSHLLGVNGYENPNPDAKVEIVLYNLNAQAEAVGISLILD